MELSGSGRVGIGKSGLEANWLVQTSHWTEIIMVYYS